jgi:hypothetical protein
MGSLSFALIGGRVFIDDLRYTTRNTSIFVHKCAICFRYWRLRHRDTPNTLSLDRARMEVQLKGVHFSIMNNRWVAATSRAVLCVCC